MSLSMRKNGFFVLFASLVAFHADAGSFKHLRNARYCEILLSQKPSIAEVYNSIGLNDCPDAQWRSLSKEKIKQSHHARFVEFNGPRYFMMDQLKNSALINKNIVSFEGVSMRLAGELHINLLP